MKEDDSQEKPEDQEQLDEAQDGVAEKVADTAEDKTDGEKS